MAKTVYKTCVIIIIGHLLKNVKLIEFVVSVYIDK